MAIDFITDIFGASAPDLLGRLVVLILVLLFTSIFRRITPYFVRRVIRAVFRAVNMVRRVEEQITEQLIHALILPIRFFITVIGLGLALLVINVSPVVNDFVADAISIALIIALFWAMYRVTDVAASYYLQQTRTTTSVLDETVTNFVRQLTKVVIVAFGLVIAMRQLGYDLGGVLAGLGLGGLAVALAAQDALSNFVGYFAIIADETYKVGDLITINDTEGFVEEFSFRSTRLRKRDRSLVLIPNKTMASADIINWSRLKKRQLKMTLGVTYSTTPEQIQAVIEDIRAMLIEHELITDDRVIVEFVEFNASSLDILIICLVDTILWEDLLSVKMDINLRLMGILKAHDVDVAFPTRTIHMHHASAANLQSLAAQQQNE